MNAYRHTISVAFVFASLFYNLASGENNDNAKQGSHGKDVVRLENELASLQKKLQSLSSKKLELQEQEVNKRQYFENQIQELKKKNTEEYDKVVAKNIDSIAPKEKQLTLFNKELENAGGDSKKKKIANKIKKVESVINELRTKASEQENQLHNKQKKSISDLEWEKEKGLLNLKLEDLDYDMKIAKVNEDIRAAKERLFLLKNYTEGYRLKKQNHVSKSAPILGGTSAENEKKKSSLEQKIKEIEEKKAKLKLDFDLQKKMSVLEGEIEKLRDEITSLESSFSENEEKINADIDKELRIALQQKTDDFEKKRKISIQKKEGEIKAINEKLSRLKTSRGSEKDSQKKESLNKEKIVLSEKVKTLTDEINSLQKNDVLDKELGRLKKDYEEKKQFLLRLQKKDIDEKWKALGELVRKKNFLSDRVDYLVGHSLDDYKKWYKDKVLEASSVSIIGSGNSPWDLQKDLDDAVKTKQKQAEKAQNDMLEKSGYTRNQHIVTIGNPQKDDDEEKDNDDKKLNLSDVLSFSTLKTSVKFPKFAPGRFPVSVSGEGTLDFNFNKLHEDKNYKKFSVKVKVGVPSINVLPSSSKESSGPSKPTEMKSPLAGSVSNPPVPVVATENALVKEINSDVPCSLIGCKLPPEQKYSPLGKHLFLHELVVSWNPLWMGFCKYTIKGGFKNDSLDSLGEVSSFFVSNKITAINDIVFFKCRLSKWVRVGSHWNPYRTFSIPTVSWSAGVKIPHFFSSATFITHGKPVGKNKVEIGLRELPFWIDLVRYRRISCALASFPVGNVILGSRRTDYKIRVKIPVKPFGKLKAKSMSFSTKFGYKTDNMDKSSNSVTDMQEKGSFITMKFFVLDFACSDMWWAKQIGLDEFSLDCITMKRTSPANELASFRWRFLNFKATFKQGFKFTVAVLEKSGSWGPSLSGSWNIVDYINYRKANKKKTANTDF